MSWGQIKRTGHGFFLVLWVLACSFPSLSLDYISFIFLRTLINVMSNERPVTRLHSVERNELSDIDQAVELLTHFQPRLIGYGGEHLVYSIPNHPKYVVKASLETTEKIASWQRGHHLSADVVTDEIRRGVANMLAEDQRLQLELRKAFGKEHVLPQKSFFKQIPLTADMPDVLKISPIPFVAPGMVWSILRIQERASALEDPKRLQLVSGYSEKAKQPLDEETYWQATEHLLDGTQTLFSTQDAFFRIQPNEMLWALCDAMQVDSGLADCVRDCVHRTIAYTQTTHEILDLAGADNLIFYKKSNGDWNYLLVDVAYGRKLMDSVSLSLEKLYSSDELQVGERNRILNGFNFVRTINGIAERLGMDERVRFDQRVTELPAQAKHRLYEELKAQMM